jgi:hypothetical protein
MEVYQSIRIYRFRIRKERKSSELAELLTLVDPKATVTKEGSVNRI